MPLHTTAVTRFAVATLVRLPSGKFQHELAHWCAPDVERAEGAAMADALAQGELVYLSLLPEPRP